MRKFAGESQPQVQTAGSLPPFLFPPSLPSLNHSSPNTTLSSTLRTGYFQLWPFVANTKFGQTKFGQYQVLAKPTFLIKLTRICVLMFWSKFCVWPVLGFARTPPTLPSLPPTNPSFSHPPPTRLLKLKYGVGQTWCSKLSLAKVGVGHRWFGQSWCWPQMVWPNLVKQHGQTSFWPKLVTPVHPHLSPNPPLSISLLLLPFHVTGSVPANFTIGCFKRRCNKTQCLPNGLLVCGLLDKICDGRTWVCHLFHYNLVWL